MEKFERLSRELKFKGSIIDFYQDQIQIPNGNIATWDYIEHKGAAGVVPVLPDGRIVMVKQYRNALNRFTLEIPAGGRESVNEEFYDCAYRELTEETGFTCERLEKLIEINTTVAFCNEMIHVFVAHVDANQGLQHLDEDEYVNVELVELDDLLKMIYDCKITDGKTIASIMAYKNLINK